MSKKLLESEHKDMMKKMEETGSVMADAMQEANEIISDDIAGANSLIRLIMIKTVLDKVISYNAETNGLEKEIETIQGWCDEAVATAGFEEEREE